MSVVEIEMRLCLVYYFERHLGLDLIDADLPASRRQIVLLNRSEIDSLRAEIE